MSMNELNFDVAVCEELISLLKELDDLDLLLEQEIGGRCVAIIRSAIWDSREHGASICNTYKLKGLSLELPCSRFLIKLKKIAAMKFKKSNGWLEKYAELKDELNKKRYELCSKSSSETSFSP